MIIECPNCRTTHSKPASEVKSGAAVTCRKCAQPFRVTPSGKIVGVTDDDPTATARGNESMAGRGFLEQRTEVISTSASSSAAPREGVGDEHAGFTGAETTQMSAAEVRARLAMAAAEASGESGAPKESTREKSRLGAPAGKKTDTGAVSPHGRLGTNEAASRRAKGREADEATVADDPERSFAMGATEIVDAESLRGMMAAANGAGGAIGSRAGEPENGSHQGDTGLVGRGLSLEAIIDDAAVMHGEMGRSLPLGEERPSPRPQRWLGEVGQPAPPMPDFPVAALKVWALEMMAYVKAQPPPVKAIIASVALIAVILAVVAVSAMSSDGLGLAYAGEDQDLMAGPGPASAYSRVGTIQRGEPIVTFDEGAIGGYFVVRDVMGRVGYLPASGISLQPPASNPGLAFSGCLQSPIEPDQSLCRERARTQFDSCRTVCEDEADAEMCREHCQDRLDACILGCDGQAPTTAPPPWASPSLDEAEPATNELESSVVAPEPGSTKKRPKKRVRRKKKRAR